MNHRIPLTIIINELNRFPRDFSCVINQIDDLLRDNHFNRNSNRHPVQDISVLKRDTDRINQIRELLLNWFDYNNRYKRSDEFYDVVFACLIILCKYWPKFNNFQESNGKLFPIGSISRQPLSSGNVFYTASGLQIGKNELKNVFKQGPIHPVLNQPFLDEDIYFLRSQSKTEHSYLPYKSSFGGVNFYSRQSAAFYFGTQLGVCVGTLIALVLPNKMLSLCIGTLVTCLSLTPSVVILLSLLALAVVGAGVGKLAGYAIEKSLIKEGLHPTVQSMNNKAHSLLKKVDQENRGFNNLSQHHLPDDNKQDHTYSEKNISAFSFLNSTSNATSLSSEEKKTPNSPTRLGYVSE